MSIQQLVKSESPSTTCPNCGSSNTVLSVQFYGKTQRREAKLRCKDCRSEKVESFVIKY